jgi:hypothetical protein
MAAPFYESFVDYSKDGSNILIIEGDCKPPSIKFTHNDESSNPQYISRAKELDRNRSKTIRVKAVQ